MMTPPAELVDAAGAGPLPYLEFVSGDAARPSSFVDGVTISRGINDDVE